MGDPGGLGASLPTGNVHVGFLTPKVVLGKFLESKGPILEKEAYVNPIATNTSGERHKGSVVRLGCEMNPNNGLDYLLNP